MDLIIKARLHNLFRAKDFNDKKRKWQLQFLDEQESGDGVQLVVHKVSILIPCFINSLIKQAKKLK